MRSMGAELKGLDPRSREILASVIYAYIRSATPVSSRQLTKTGAFGLSSASLRNAMADLEDFGFLTHPHVSAGRVPTDLGYRTFVEQLMEARGPTVAERAWIASELQAGPFELDRFLKAASRVVSRLTGEVGVVAAPDPLRFVLDSVHFQRAGERKVLVVQVSAPGHIESWLIETREEFSQAELDDASRRLTIDYHGRPLFEIRLLLVEALAEEKVRMDAALARVSELGRRAFAESRTSGEELYVEGLETILQKPEFQSDVEALRRMLHAFDEKARLVNLLTDCLASDGPRVVIGSEHAFTEETGSAVVATPYGSGDRVLGALGVIGPRRMEYGRVVPLVAELGRYITKRLTEGAA